MLYHPLRRANIVAYELDKVLQSMSSTSSPSMSQNAIDFPFLLAINQHWLSNTPVLTNPWCKPLSQERYVKYVVELTILLGKG